MNAKLTNKDKVYVYSSFKKFCLQAFSRVSSDVGMDSSELQ